MDATIQEKVLAKVEKIQTEILTEHIQNLVATTVDTRLNQLEIAYAKHHESIGIMGEGLTQCQRDIQILRKSFGTLKM